MPVPTPSVPMPGPDAARLKRLLMAFLTIATAIYAVEFWLARTVPFPGRVDVLALAITTDLTLVIPFLCRSLVVRPRRLNAAVLVPVFVLSVLGATLILPESRRGYIHLLGYVFGLAELAGIVYGGVKVRDLVRAYRATPTDLDFEQRFRAAAEVVLGRNPFTAYLALEFSVPYFALLSWRRPVPQGPRWFTVHENSGYGGIVFGFSMAILFESIAVHFLVDYYAGPVIAWILTATSVYTLLWLIADYGAMRLRPFRVEDDALHLALGLRRSVTVPREKIAAVRRITAVPSPKPAGYLNLMPMGDPQFEIVLSEPVSARGLLGIERQVSRIALQVDDPARFAAVLGVKE